MTREQDYLLQALGKALFGAEIQAPAGLDWRAFLRESTAQSVLPLAVSAVKPWIPQEDYQAVKVTESKIIAGSMKQEREHARLHRYMSEAGVSYAVLKGSASAAYYPEPLLRTMGDVDFLVPEEELPRAEAALEAHGFVQTEERGRYHVSYACGGEKKTLTSWELHWEPNGVPDGEQGRLIREKLRDLAERSLLHEGQFGPYRVPDPFSHGLVLLLHNANHLINSGIGLRHLCDWAVFAASMEESDLRALFEPFLRQAGLWNFLVIQTALCARYLHAGNEWTLPLTDGDLLEKLMEDVFASGNFGVKDDQRLNQAKLLTTKSSATVDDATLLRKLGRSMNEKARRRLPACRRQPLLLPVGWAVVGGEHLGRMFSGKRPGIRLEETLRGAKRRKEIYRPLRLFEVDEEEELSENGRGKRYGQD